MGKKGGVDELFHGSPNVNWFTEYRTRTITKKCSGLRASSPFRVTSKRANERWRKRRALTFFPCTLLPHLVSPAELSELSKSLLTGCYGFRFCERWLHRHYNGSVNSKCTHYPKAFVKFWHLLWLSTSEPEWTKLLKLSSLAKPVNSNHFREIYLQLSEEICPFLGKKNQPFSKLKSIAVLF